MDAHEARRILADRDDPESPVDLPPSVLPKLTVDDLPDGGAIQVGTLKKGVMHLDWNGTLSRDGDEIFGEADHTWTRKYWYSPLGLEQYLDLVRRAVETRHRGARDVELTDYDDDGAYVALRFRINTAEKNLGKAYEAIRKITDEVEEAAQQAADEVGQRIAEVAARLSGWGSETLDALVDAVETTGSADDKGRTELVRQVRQERICRVPRQAGEPEQQMHSGASHLMEWLQRHSDKGDAARQPGGNSRYSDDG